MRHSLTLEPMSRQTTIILALVIAFVVSVVSACFVFRDDLLFAWDGLSYPVPEDFVDKQIGRIVKNRGCSPRQLALFEDYCHRSAVGGLYAYGEMWSLFVRDPEMIRRINAADSTGKLAFGILHNGPSCYLEFHDRQIPEELAVKATTLYHRDLPNYLPNTTGLQEEWDRLVTDRGPSTQPAQPGPH